MLTFSGVSLSGSSYAPMGTTLDPLAVMLRHYRIECVKVCFHPTCVDLNAIFDGDIFELWQAIHGICEV